jgi:hypothetical protein
MMHVSILKKFLSVYERILISSLLLENDYFSGIVMFVIFLNAVTIAVETSSSLKDTYPMIFLVADNVFFSVYLLEFLLKLYAEPVGYWKNPYNLFDLFVLVLLFVQVALDAAFETDTGFSALKVLRGDRKRTDRQTDKQTDGQQFQIINNIIYRS